MKGLWYACHSWLHCHLNNKLVESNGHFEYRHRMINKLDNSNVEVAKQIFTTFQNSYKIEAQLIGTLDFPPLARSVRDIENSTTLFYGFSEKESLAAVIEFVINGELLDINSLTVDPCYFRNGIADKLISYVLHKFNFSKAIVETAVVNTPAINLYKKHGFVEFKRWTPSHGIEKLAMSVEMHHLQGARCEGDYHEWYQANGQKACACNK
jgi:ribosomal protein S18 acetylase RimI-like enzyme